LFASVAALALLVPGTASGQAWTQPAGHAYLKVSSQQTAANEQFRQDGSLAPYAPGVESNGFEDSSRYLYAEYGLRDGLTVIALLPWKRITVSSPHPQAASGLPGTDRPITASASGFERLKVALRMDVSERIGLRADGRHRSALNVSAHLPLGYDRDAMPGLGPGQVDLDAMLFFGTSFWPVPAYAQLGAGFRVRTGLFGLSRGDSPEPDYGNEWLVHAEAGLNLGKQVLLQGLVLGAISNESPQVAFDPQNPIPTHQRYLKTGLGATFSPIPLLGLSFQIFSTASGANTVRSTDIFFGLEARL
jgi:hypothetical protein